MVISCGNDLYQLEMFIAGDDDGVWLKRCQGGLRKGIISETRLEYPFYLIRAMGPFTVDKVC